MKQFKTVRGYIGYLCRLEGGKSQSKIHDAVQIMNRHYDILFEDRVQSSNLTAERIREIASNPLDDDAIDVVLIRAAAKRWLKNNNEKKK